MADVGRSPTRRGTKGFFEIYSATDIEAFKEREFVYDTRRVSKCQRQEASSLGKELIGHTVVVS
jgi:hypothetical protein